MKTTFIILAILIAGCATTMPAQVAETSMAQVTDASLAQVANVTPPVPMRPFSPQDDEVYRWLTERVQSAGCYVTHTLDISAMYGHLSTWTWGEMEYVRLFSIECESGGAVIVVGN